MNRPKCEVEECNNGGIVLFCGKLICGSCYMKYSRATENMIWEIINNDKENTRNR